MSSFIVILADAACSAISEPAPHELDQPWKNRNDNDAENEESQVILYYRYIAKEESSEHEETDPENAAEGAVSHETGINHSSDTCDKRRKSTDDRQKTCKNYSLSTVPGIKGLGFFQMGAIQ